MPTQGEEKPFSLVSNFEASVTPELQKWLRTGIGVQFQGQFKEDYDDLRVKIDGVDSSGFAVKTELRVECSIYDRESYAHDLNLLIQTAHGHWLRLKHPLDDD